MKTSKDAVILATRKGVLVLDYENKEWRVKQHAFPGIPVSYAFRHPTTGEVWAGLDTDHWGAKLQRSKDGGENWDDVEMPAYPEGAEIKPGIPAALSYIWTITAGHPDDPQRVYVGTEPGGLFQSDNGGDSFHLVEGLWNHPTRDQWLGGGRDHPGLHSIVVDPKDKQRMWVGISVAGVYESTDGGKSWTPRNKGLKADYLPNPDAEVGHDPHLLALNFNGREVMMQQNHCGIFRSTDGAKAWKKVSQENGPAHFGFAIQLDEEDADTAWVIPAVSDQVRMAVDGALCVSRTEDGGENWTAFREGLPQENCYDFVFRHALAKRGERLIFGTSTGNLFVSEDRGESWECAGNYFPPVYSVRFME